MPKKFENQGIRGRKTTEEELKETTNYLESLFNYANAPIIVWDTKFRITRFNPAFEHLTGKSAKKVVGKKLDILFPHNKRKEAMVHIRSTLKGKRWEVLEIPIQHTNGTVRIVLWNSANIYSSDGKRIISTIAQGQDITERKQAEQTLLESEKQRFGDVVENARDWIWEVDTNGQYTYSSPVVKKILGYKPEEVLKMHFYDFFHPENKEEMKKLALEAFAKKEPFREFINLNIRKDGKGVWLSTSGVPILDAKGNLLGYRGADTDITELKKANIELQKKVDELERFHNLVVGRELKMVELKEKIKELKGSKKK